MRGSGEPETEPGKGVFIDERVPRPLKLFSVVLNCSDDRFAHLIKHVKGL